MGEKYMITAAHYPFSGFYDKFLQTNWFVVYLAQLTWVLFVKKYEIVNVKIRRIKNG